MENSLIFHALVSWKILSYFIVFIGMMVEGDLLLFATAFLTRQGFFNLGSIAIVIFASVVIGDLIWYELGFKINKWPKIPYLSMKLNGLINDIDYHIAAKPFFVILISKFTYGFHHIVLARVGAKKMPFKKFISIEFLSAIIWIIVVGGLGYIAQASYAAFKHYLRFAEIGLFISLALFFIFSVFITRFLKKEI